MAKKNKDNIKVYWIIGILVAILFLWQSGALKDLNLFSIGQICEYPFNNNGLVGYWNLDEYSIIQEDMSGKGNNGITYGDMIRDNGKFGGAYHFDGIDDSINVTNDKSLNLTNSLTISAWVNLDGQKAFDRIIAKSYNSAVLPYTMYGIILSGGTIHPTELKGQVRMELAQNGTQHLVHTTSILPKGQWTHIVGTYDGNTGEAKMYFNGVLETEGQQIWEYNGTSVGRYENISGPLDFSDMPVIIGWDGLSGNETNRFNGTIDEIMIWNIALNATEVQRLYQLTSYDKICVNQTINNQTNQNSTANQTNTSSSGSSSNLGGCTTNSLSQSCIITNGVGTQIKTCSNSTWSEWSNCTVVSCNVGYKQEGNICLKKDDFIIIVLGGLVIMLLIFYFVTKKKKR